MNPTEPGIHNSIDGQMSPDIQAAFHIFAAHWRKVNAEWQYPVCRDRLSDECLYLERGFGRTDRPFLQWSLSVWRRRLQI